MSEIREIYLQWLNEPTLDEKLKEELVSIPESEIIERFYTELEFGTAGLRGILGAGTNRMNVHVVRRATKGLADYINTFPNGATRGVAIAYDSRHMSKEFALETALVLANNGIKTYLYSTLHSVPQLSFTINHLGCIAGVVITASHNPSIYNGYKVYWEDGGQAAPAQASEILSFISKSTYFGVKKANEQQATEAGLLNYIGKEIDEAYYASTKTLLLYPELLKEKGHELNLVYTPLHGSGNVPVRELLASVGVNVFVVEEQAEPDGSFPTVKAPNPEDENAFTLAFELAEKVGANAVLATDPDSDRLGVAVRTKDGSFKVLTGNQIGSLLVHYLLSSKKEKGELPENGLIAKSLVSTRMADAIAKYFNIECVDVPTGFRFISEIIKKCKEDRKHEFIFGFEESFGFLAGTFSRDKDAICAAMLVAEACVHYIQQNKTLYDVLCEMYTVYGMFKESVKSYTLSGKEGIEKIAAAMVWLREHPSHAIGGVEIESTEDMKKGTKLLPNGEIQESAINGVDVLRYNLDGGAWVCVRPSGTEPKLKLYIGANAENEAMVDELLNNVMTSMNALLDNLLFK